MSTNAAPYPPKDANGNPPTISLTQYDEAPWASRTCVDDRNGKYVAVDMEKNDIVVAEFESLANVVLDKIFKSAKQNFYENK